MSSLKQTSMILYWVSLIIAILALVSFGISFASKDADAKTKFLYLALFGIVASNAIMFAVLFMNPKTRTLVSVILQTFFVAFFILVFTLHNHVHKLVSDKALSDSGPEILKYGVVLMLFFTDLQLYTIFNDVVGMSFVTN
jgi:hypothetical protein